MELNEYQQLAMRTLSSPSKDQKILTAVLGLNGEAGEVAELLKKAMFHGHMWDDKAFIKEIGDILWYCACAAEGIGVSLSDIATLNIKKLMDRYPAAFETERSINKDETKEAPDA